MNKDQFIKVLERDRYKWREEGEWIIVEEPDYVNLYSLKSIPDNVKFNNRGWVYLDSLKSIPDNVKFNNKRDIYLRSLKSMGNNVEFNNGGNVHLGFLKSIHITEDIEEMFSKCGDVKINEKWLDLEKNMAFPESRWTSVKEMVTN